MANKTAGGKKAGLATSITRTRSAEIIKSGSAPLDIMLANMTFWHTSSEELAQRGLELMAKIDADTEATPAEKIEMLKSAGSIMKNFANARNHAQSCAVDAAPYVHPRLAAITFRKPEDEVLIIEADLAAPIPGQLDDRSYRDNYKNVTPLRKSA